MNVVVDCNVIVSAARIDGTCREVLDRVVRHHDIVLSEPILAEYVHVADRPRQAAYRQALLAVIREIERLATIVEPADTLFGLRDPDDEIYLATAMAGSAVLITGNRRDFTEPRYATVDVLSRAPSWIAPHERLLHGLTHPSCRAPPAALRPVRSSRAFAVSLLRAGRGPSVTRPSRTCPTCRRPPPRSTAECPAPPPHPAPGGRGSETSLLGVKPSQGGEDRDTARLCRHRIARHAAAHSRDHDRHGRMARAPRLAPSLRRGGRCRHGIHGRSPGRAPHRVPAVAGYRGCAGPDCRTLSPDRMHTCLAIAADLHPAWHRCSPAARKLHARNVSILAVDTDAPVDAVSCWTRGGLPSGGTGMGIRIARRYGIPVLNLGVMHPRAACERLEEIRAALSPGTRPARSGPLEDGSTP